VADVIIIVKIDYEGANFKEDLKKLDAIQTKIQKQIGGKLDGPYLPQDASMLYILHVDKYEALNLAGRVWYDEITKAKLPFAPKTYEVCVTPAEFFG